MAKKQPAPLLTPDASVKAFVKLIESGGHSRSVREKFGDFLELAYCAIAKPCAPNAERADALEARYMKVVGRYREEELTMIRETYPKMLAIMVAAVAPGGVDFLGTVAGEINALNSEQGQFFTPFEVSKMMAAMTVGGTEIELDGYLTLSEPAAGAGGMVLAYADVIEGMGHDITTSMLVQAVDVSETAYKMCYLQLSARGVPAHVIRGNTLSMETWESAWTPAAIYRFLPHHGHLRFDKPKRVTTTAIIPIGERRTLVEATFRYRAEALPDVIEEAEAVVEAAFEQPQEAEPEGNYEQLTLF